MFPKVVEQGQESNNSQEKETSVHSIAKGTQLIAPLQVMTIQIPPVVFSFGSSATHFFIRALFSLQICVKIRGEKSLLLSMPPFAFPHSSALFFTGETS